MIELTLSRLGEEALDTRSCAPDIARATLRDIAISNALFGGRSAAAFGLRLLLQKIPAPGRPLILLDLGAGSGDIARHLTRRARTAGVDLIPVAVDTHRAAARLCRAAGLHTVIADAAALPFRDKSVDIVLVSQFLHHFTRETAATLVRALHRLARVGVIIADARRTAAAAAGIWLASHVLRFHPTTRHDGVLSVRRSFTATELASLLTAGGVRAHVHRRPGFRLVAAWRTPGAQA